MIVHPKEVEKVSSLEPIERYKYFIKKVADNEELYTLMDNLNNYVVSEIDNNFLFPMWSAKEFIEHCKVKGWENHKIKKITLDDLENEIFDFIASRNYLINVFPIVDKTGFIVDLDEFARDLSNELQNYH